MDQLHVILTDYKPFIPGMAGIIAIDVPAPFRGDQLLLGRYTFLIYESEAEKQQIFAEYSPTEFQAWWQKWENRPTRQAGKKITNAVFEPPKGTANCPYFFLMYWPKRFQAMAGPLSRGAYSIEAFMTYGAALDHAGSINETFARAGVRIVLQSPEAMSEGGNA